MPGIYIEFPFQIYVSQRRKLDVKKVEGKPKGYADRKNLKELETVKRLADIACTVKNSMSSDVVVTVKKVSLLLLSSSKIPL